MLPKAGLGQQLWHALALKGSRPSKANHQSVKDNKGLKTTEEVSVFLTGGIAVSPHAAFSPFSWGKSSDRTCGNGSKLHRGKFRLDIRNHFSTKRVAKHWKQTP